MADAAALSEVFRQTLAPQKEVIQNAEAQLKSLALQPQFSVSVLQVVAATALDEAVRLAAGVNFKNIVKYRWAPSDTDAYSGVTALPENEKVTIKQLLTSLMLNTPAKVRAQLSEALAIICQHDFPKNWPTLLPELVQRLANADLAAINGVLATANSIFKRYRDVTATNRDAVVAELAECQNIFAPTLLETQKQLAVQFQATQDPAVQKAILSCVRLSFRIFYSLNALGVTPLMDEQLKDWMGQFNSFLTVPDLPALEEKDADKESVLDAVRCAACSNINLYMEQNEEEFQPYLQTFASVVWTLLLRVSQRPGQDNLAMAGIRFLTTISKSYYHTLFGEAGALQQICESIIVPNLQVRDEDAETFEMNPLEYIRRDSEGSDSDTRRRAAADLVKSLTDKYPQEVTQLCAGYVQKMLSDYAANPGAAWRSKDCAIYLVLALTVRGKTAAKGATTTNQLVNIQDFYQAQVLPELQSPRLEDVPILKADAIKFVTTFRSLLPKEALMGVIPSLINLLSCQSCVVHSYAATAIDKLLALKVNNQPVFTPADLQPYLSDLLTKLFAGFQLPDSSENEYLMRAVTRVIGFVGAGITPVASVALQQLAAMLLEVCKNPRTPGFNHYLFEAVAALIRHSDPSQISTFENLLFPAFNHVLQADVQEFHPYVFQIFAQLIELRSPPLPAVYMQIFAPLLLPQFWERSGNVPALVRLLQAYLAKAGDQVLAAGHLLAILGVFQKLISSKAHDHEGFHVLCSIVDNLPLAAYEQHLATIFTLLFSRLQSSRTVKYVRHFLIFLSTFIIKHGPQTTAAVLDRVQPGMMAMLLQQIWLPNMNQLVGADEKLMLVATARCLSELPALQANTPLWGALKEAAYKQMEASKQPGLGAFVVQQEDEDGVEVEEVAGYQTAYAQLANAARPARPVLVEIADPKQFMDQQLAKVTAVGL